MPYVEKYSLLSNQDSNCLFSEQMFKGKENHLNLIQEVRTENALQQAEQQLLREDIQLVKTLTEQRDAARHEVKQTARLCVEAFYELHAD